MYIVTPFPNIVYALDLNDDGRVIWKYEPKQDPSVIAAMCCDTVNRGAVYGDGKIVFAQADSTLVALDAATGAAGVAGQERRSRQGRGEHRRAADLQGQGLYRRLRRRVGRAGLSGRLQSQRRQAGLARLLGRTRRPDADRRREDHPSRQAGRQGQRHGDLGRRAVEAGRRHHLGLVLGRSRAEPDLLRHRQPGHLEPGAAPRRQSLVDDHLRPRRRYRRGEVGLSDDAPRRVGL